MPDDHPAHASLDLTHVLYEADSHLSLALALITLSPILLMPAYASLALYTRELIIFEMWAGQLACESFNWLLKHAIKQDRPVDSVGTGYGFPSSHSQWMGYFASFLALHLWCRHRFASTGWWIVDKLWRLCIYIALISWAGVVCFSRYQLGYHSSMQVLWGLSIGVAFGTFTYTVLELVPFYRPFSLLGRMRHAVLESSLAQWCRLRDGWAVWEDGGREEEWQRWLAKWERVRGRQWRNERMATSSKAK